MYIYKDLLHLHSTHTIITHCISVVSHMPHSSRTAALHNVRPATSTTPPPTSLNRASSSSFPFSFLFDSSWLIISSQTPWAGEGNLFLSHTISGRMWLVSRYPRMVTTYYQRLKLARALTFYICWKSFGFSLLHTQEQVRQYYSRALYYHTASLHSTLYNAAKSRSPLIVTQ